MIVTTAGWIRLTKDPRLSSLHTGPLTRAREKKTKRMLKARGRFTLRGGDRRKAENKAAIHPFRIHVCAFWVDCRESVQALSTGEDCSIGPPPSLTGRLPYHEHDTCQERNFLFFQDLVARALPQSQAFLPELTHLLPQLTRCSLGSQRANPEHSPGRRFDRETSARR